MQNPPIFSPSTVGRLIVIVGPMFSGKTSELTRLYHRLRPQLSSALVFKPMHDNRYEPNKVMTHNKHGVEAIRIDSEHPELILQHILGETTHVFIDEAQFFTGQIVDVVKLLIRKGIHVVCAGLLQDFRGEPFGPMPLLVAYADQIESLTALCAKCGQDATKTQRLIDGVPANYYDPIMVVGADDMYEARCSDHHQVPGRP